MLYTSISEVKEFNLNSGKATWNLKLQWPRKFELSPGLVMEQPGYSFSMMLRKNCNFLKLNWRTWLVATDSQFLCSWSWVYTHVKVNCHSWSRLNILTGDDFWIIPSSE